MGVTTHPPAINPPRSPSFPRLSPDLDDPYLIDKTVGEHQIPSRVTSMLRTISPPPGCSRSGIFRSQGSKRTMVLGSAKDSLYQTAPLVNTMPSGWTSVRSATATR